MDDITEPNTLSELLGPSAIASSSSQAYLSYLTTLPLQNLLSEPSLLQTQSHHLTSSLTSLTHTSYPTFLSLHGTTTALSDSLDALSASLDTIINDSLPALEESATNWRERTESVLGERRKARVVLDHHDKIRDLLDIPLLIDTCVRNGFFSEALSLASHATSLHSSSSTSPPLILSSILSEVKASITQMLFSLLATLHEPNRKLPALWKAVNFLRKMEVFDLVDDVQPEEQIALAFLTGRESCLQATLDGRKHDIERLVGMSQRDLNEKDKEELLKTFKSYIESWREGVHDIITQFATIFLERSGSGIPQETSLPSLQALITTYASHSLHRHLIPILQTTLPRIPLSSLSPFLNQLTYCATAFARIGLDFRGIIGDLFSKTVVKSVQDEIQDATSKLVQLFKQKTGRPTSSQVCNSTPPSGWAILSSAASAPPTSNNASKEIDVPPRVLACYPPLAQYTNALLTTFNSFRQLAPTSLASSLQSALDDHLAEAGASLLRYLKNVAGNSEMDRKIAQAMGTVYFRTFFPFMRRALGEGIYGLEGDYQTAEDPSSLKDVVREWESWLETISS